MTDIAEQKSTNHGAAPAIVSRLGDRSIVLIGMMGVGKSSIGRRLGARLGIPFVDADAEIESAAGMGISDIFTRHGEAAFRSGEARVMIKQRGVSIWLSAELDLLMRRISKRKAERPMLQTDDPVATLRELLATRGPIYAQADITVQSRDVPHDAIVTEIVEALAGFLGDPPPERSQP